MYLSGKVKSSLVKKTKDRTNEILSNIGYLLNRPNNSLPWDPSAEKQAALSSRNSIQK